MRDINDVRGVQLTENERRLLRQLAIDDLKLYQAADAQNRSFHTINKRIANIKMRLGTSTLAATVFRAANLGLLDDSK